jgi:sugar phosphate isomerase/epimerase
LSPEAAREVAVPFFRTLGEAARVHGLFFCIEPNPKDYGCDFVTTVAEALDLVDAVGSEGFGLHMDTGGMTLAGESASEVAEAAARYRHFHISTPFLEGVHGSPVDHAAFAEVLRNQGYNGCVSIEMSEAKLRPTWQEGVKQALDFAQLTYGSPGTPCGQRRTRWASPGN